ncbi:NUDIX hydrolase [Allostreptomyces psammosilenae]|uniref:8-oxo-dGTP pyrophosphatase MutT (NUDIX family) n=1 Tax=Allostreptomyces psammosilenae TaxID=1892865 RepID=A0A852ZYG5_9ACTN|nr:NUDIX domain-containing protein [Allostreptomyces psammosilenae]NYI06270.1 8-oxo-dGTP pyrophosphatase MutT (NUDIX family) [Allostreptomyces psammosilenae]
MTALSTGAAGGATAGGALRDDALRVLSGWSAPDERQEALRAAFVDYLAANPDGLSRGSAGGRHLTASALVVDPSSSRVLLTLHPRVGSWLQMGGHCEAHDASLAAAALREATEESGVPGLTLSAAPLRLDRHLVPCRDGVRLPAADGGPGDVSEHLDVQYLAVAPPDAVARISEESLDLRWFPADRLPDGADHSVRALVSQALATL